MKETDTLKIATMLKLCLLAVLLGAAIAEDSYVIVAPTTIRPGMDFEISTNILKATGNVNVKATLKMSKQSITTVSGVLKQGQPQSLTLKVPKVLQTGSYSLEVTGSGGLTFSNQTSIKYSSRSKSIFIQTDKAMYKPGQTVNFRVFGMYPDMKLYAEKYSIDIYDPNSNKIKQWIDVQDASGVITNFLSMTDQPVLGDWKIKVTADRDSEEKTFTIAEYVLPKFEVTVELPSYALNADSDITATVKAKYTYGKPVKGTVNLEAKIENYYKPWNYHGSEPMIHKTLTIDGESKVKLSLAEMKKVFTNGLAGRKIQVLANVTEDLTGITLNGKSTVQIYNHATKLSFSPADPKTFKPGLKYIAYLQVQQQDGRPVQLSSQKVTVSTRVTSEKKLKDGVTTPAYYYPQHSYYNIADQTFSVPQSGVVPIEVHIPANASNLALTVKYGKVSTYKNIDKSYSPSDNYIQLLLKSQHLSSGGTVNFDVKATEPVGTLVYQVMSRGSIVSTGTINGNQKEMFNFNIPVTSKMAPNARIIVYYVRQGGEIVTDSVSFDVEGAFENQVSISMDKTSAKPGEQVNVKVTADPQSLVNLLAVDQSVLLLKSGNDITQAQVIDELKSYDTLKSHGGFYGGGRPIALRGKRMAFPICDFCWGWPTYYGGSDASQIFQNAGVVVMTDALVYKYVKPYYRPRYFRHMMFAGGRVAMARAPMRAPQFARSEAIPQKQFEKTGPKLAEPERTRIFFPETWLWTNITSGADGTATISTTVPDTITSWVASAFAVNSQTGLGVAPTSSKIRVFRPFFVSLNLPYSVTRGEQVALQAIVFNYLTQDVDVVVSLPMSQEYQNVIIDSNGRERLDSKDITQTVHVKAGQAMSVFFPIVPKTLGKIDFTVSARSTLAADAVKRQLLVEPEGTPKEYNIPVLIDLKKVTTFSKQAQITLPTNVVAGSVRARVTAIGDLMGPTVSGLDSLLKMPTGCGEQTMLGFAPDVFVTNYLTATKQLTGDIEDKALNYMEKGYQRELTYQHKDGSFSAFGDRDPSGSMWLTAFVVKTFHQAKPYIFIDDEVMSRGISWMLDKQTSDGQFPEPGRVIHTSMTGGSGKGTALTAFVLIALLENSDLKGGIQQRISTATAKAVRYLETHTPTDDYNLAITTYALQLAGSPTADTYFATLKSHAITKDGFQYWHRPEVKTTQKTNYWRPPNSKKAIDIEMTSYALLVYHERNDFAGGLNAMKWIASQRNPNGGFSSTQDTVLALQALSEFAKMAYSNNFDVQVTVTSPGFNHAFSINQKNALVLQSVELPGVPQTVQVHATGNGIALVEISVFFNVDADVEEPTFSLSWKITEEDINSITLQTCASWLGPDTSGMAIQEVGLPSGFDVDLDTITKLKILKKIETPNKKVVLYFDEIGTTPVCMTFNLMRTGLVAKSQPVPIRVYDYYEPTNQKTVFYESSVLKNSNICSVCADCDNCSVKPGK